MGNHYLDRLFSPRGVAVFGANNRKDSVGGRVFHNLLADGFPGPVFPINPKHRKVGRRTCYASLRDVPEAVDLAVIVTPAPTVPAIVRECGEHGVRAAIVISAGFGEVAGKGHDLQDQLLDAARQYNMRILGPNCLGMIRPHSQLNATFSKNTAKPGSLALVSQSGALCTAILDWAESRRIGFSAMISMGDAADLDFGDILDFLALDPMTHSILLYVEGISNARGFISGLRVAARMKPVIVIKSGRHEEGTRAAVSHTGALIGADDAFDAALQRAGAVRAFTVEQLFAAAQLLATQRTVGGNRLAIVTNAGGPGVMATDRATDLGVRLAPLVAETIAKLDSQLPDHWSHGNPVDILGDAPPERYHAAVSACLEDDEVDGVLVMLTPQAMTRPQEAAQAVIDARGVQNKPVLACWMGETQVAGARQLFAENRVPSFPNPEASVEAFAYLATYHRNQQLLMQVPGPRGRMGEPDAEGARMIIEGALEEHRSMLNPLEAKALLTAFRIPVVPMIEAHSANEALVAAESLRFPVVLKINSPDITHKSDVRGVRLNITNAQAVRSNYNELLAAVRETQPDAEIAGVTVEPMVIKPHGRELIVGVVRDPVFGPVISFGSGGTEVEILRDRAVALPPLNTYLSKCLIQQTRAYRLLGEFRNLPPADLEALKQVLRRVSEMVCALPQIRELDINPLLADEAGTVAVDVRVVIEHAAHSADRFAHMAIHPYPGHLTSGWQLVDGTDIFIRPIRPEDAEIEQRFVRELSPKSRYFRFMQGLRELTPQMLVRFTQIDYDRELALLAVVRRAADELEVGVARYGMNPDRESCEFALVVADAWQRRGIGTQLMNCLIDAARDKGFKTMTGEILTENTPMLKLVSSLGFEVRASADDPSIKAVRRRL
ncbi:MAG: bifunctional acetate--CoA ligase family protein/GNAT family N-acetyltransferase [Pseudomonadota bacterium]|nr:MAG: bifunctional acetate--CoA ligase family protein/GNAT family N-acetyltransferase [Pseudomonadota bacterium]